MKPFFLIPSFAVLAAAGGGALSLQAQHFEKSKSQCQFQYQFNSDQREANAVRDSLRHMMEQFDSGCNEQRQLNEALERWVQDDGPGQSKQFRFEYRDDGSGPKLFRDGKEIKPKDGQDPFKQMQEEMMKEMEDQMRKQFGGGGGGNPLDELFKKMREQQGGGPRQKGVPDLQDQLKRMSGAQGAVGESSRFSKNHRSALSEWRPLVKEARESTVRVMRDSRQVALGTIVSVDGYALTKASEVEKGDLEAEFHDGRIVKAKVVDKLTSYDLALIKLEATGLTPSKFADRDATVATLVAAVGLDEDPIAMGIISVAARSLNDRGKGALGISFDSSVDEFGKGVTIGKIFPGCAAERAGLKEGDIILSINGNNVDFPAQLQKVVSAMKPGDNVKVKYSRKDKEEELQFALSSREDLMAIQREEAKKQGVDLQDRRNLDPTAQMGTVLSGQASGYPNAVQSDFTIDASDCGGPVVDALGHVVAINIARSERVSTYMVPGKVVRELLSNVQSGKFTLAKDADTLKGELRDYEAAIKKAQDAVKEAEAKRAEAEAELKSLSK